MTRGSTASVLALALVAGLAPAVHAQIYRWTNDRGELHITEGLESVPARFRAGAVLLGHPAAPAPAPAAEGAGTPAAAGDVGGVLVRIPFVPGSPIVVSARVNGGRNVQLVLDTGADRTVISPQALSALGVDMRPLGRGTVQGVTGVVTDVDIVRVESLELGEAKAGPIAVIAHNSNLTRGEGLLGRDFLDRFTVNIDTRAREVVLVRR
jgi:hypothetical protein